MIIFILAVGICLTVRSGVLQVRYLPKALKFMVKNEEGGHGEVSSFGALCTALSATIGTGNIVGVATAVCAGGDVYKRQRDNIPFTKIAYTYMLAVFNKSIQGCCIFIIKYKRTVEVFIRYAVCYGRNRINNEVCKVIYKYYFINSVCVGIKQNYIT